MKTMRGNVRIVEACVILHNICIAEGDESINDLTHDEDKEEFEIDDTIMKLVAITKRDMIDPELQIIGSHIVHELEDLHTPTDLEDLRD
jgi:hypothetical protein